VGDASGWPGEAPSSHHSAWNASTRCASATVQTAHLDGDDVESHRVHVEMVAREIHGGDARDLMLLQRGHGLERAAVRVTASGSHLREDDRALVEGDDVELACGAAVVAGENRVAAGAEERRGERLALGAAALSLARHGCAAISAREPANVAE